MTSFINLLASDVWSAADIKSRLHAEIRSEVSELAETELNRALQGKALGMHTMTDAETALLMQFKAATDRVALLGVAARADMELLGAVLMLETAQRRLALPILAAVMSSPPETQGAAPTTDFVPAVTNQGELDADAAGRSVAQSVVSAASSEASALVILRSPPLPPVANTGPQAEPMPLSEPSPVSATEPTPAPAAAVV